MSLFGRRKPGFSKEVELKPGEIEGEFSDRNDPAVNKRDANPKTEKEEYYKAAKRWAGEGGETPGDGEAPDMAQQAAAEGRKVDLFEYMDSLPDVEDPFKPSENPMIDAEPEPEPLPEHMVLAEYIRDRSRAAQITPKKALAEEEPQLEELLAKLREECPDIKTVAGKKDEYLYSDAIMANNYAMIAMLVYEKDLARTVAHMVRFNCKTYPAPTPVDYFTRTPYNYTKVQMQNVLRVFEHSEEYKDIKPIETYTGVVYLYSEDVMSLKYAKALADDAQRDETDR